MSEQADRDALDRLILGRICSVSNLPDWMQVPALGRSMQPLADLIVDAILASDWLAQRDRRVAAEALREAGEACRRMAGQAEVDAGGKLDRWDAFTEAEDWCLMHAARSEASE